MDSMSEETPLRAIYMWDHLKQRESWWTALFRFTPVEFFQTLAPALYLPDRFRVDGHSCEGELALLMLLAKMSSPRPLCPDMEMIFLQDESRISRFINAAMTHIYSRFAYTFAFDTRRLRANVDYYASLVGRKFGVPNPEAFHVWGFIDGVFRHFGRPTAGQESVYNGAWSWTASGVG